MFVFNVTGCSEDRINADIPSSIRIVTKEAVWMFQINELRMNRQLGVYPDYRP